MPVPADPALLAFETAIQGGAISFGGPIPTGLTNAVALRFGP